MNDLKPDLFLTKTIRQNLIVGEFGITNIYAFRDTNGVAETYTTFVHKNVEFIIRLRMDEKYIVNNHLVNIKNELDKFSEFEADPDSFTYLVRHAQKRNILNNSNARIALNYSNTYKAFSNLIEFGGSPINLIDSLNKCEDITSFLSDYDF